jgi:hypothetical protein
MNAHIVMALRAIFNPSLVIPEGEPLQGEVIPGGDFSELRSPDGKAFWVGPSLTIYEATPIPTWPSTTQASFPFRRDCRLAPTDILLEDAINAGWRTVSG